MRRNIIISLSLFVVACGLGYVFTNSQLFNLCISDSYSCRDFYNHVGDPLFYGAGALAIVFLFLAIFPYAWNAWKSFALWFLPLALSIFISYKGPGGGFLDPRPSSVSVYRWIAIVYVLISLIIIGVSLVLKKMGKTSNPKTLSPKKKIIFWSLWSVYIAVLFVPIFVGLSW